MIIIMREFDSSPGRTILIPVIIGIIITASVVSGAYFISTYTPTNPPTGTTTSTSTTTEPTETTTTTTMPVGTYGELAADFINSRRDDIVFFWHYNNSFVNQNLSAYYDEQHSGAYVDGLYMLNTNLTPMVRLLFHPYHDNIRGEGEITQLEWEMLSGLLVDDGIKLMPNSESTQELWPPDYMVEVCFLDGTSFHLSYFRSTGLVFIAEGTWSGFNEYGWAMSSFDDDSIRWLDEDGHLQAYLTALFDTVTTNVDYPE